MSIINTHKDTLAAPLAQHPESTSPEYQAWAKTEIEAAQVEAQNPDNLVSHSDVRALLGLE